MVLTWVIVLWNCSSLHSLSFWLLHKNYLEMHGVDLTKAFDMLDWAGFFLKDLFLAHDFYHIKLKSMIGGLLLAYSISMCISHVTILVYAIRSDPNNIHQPYSLTKTNLCSENKTHIICSWYQMVILLCIVSLIYKNVKRNCRVKHFFWYDMTDGNRGWYGPYHISYG